MSTLESLIHAHPRNQGTPLNLDRIEGLTINRSAVERRAATLGGRRTVKKEWQAAWLLQAIRCIDLTALSGDDTSGNVHRMCAKAKQPVRQDLLDSMGVEGITTGAVCVYHQYVDDCVKSGWNQHSRCCGLHRLPSGPFPPERADSRDSSQRCRWSKRNRYCHQPQSCPSGKLASTL